MPNNKSFKHKQDPHYLKAKQEGYRARSAYKLLDIQHRFNIFKRAFYILDIGSAPGSWLQVAKEFAEKNLVKYNDKYYHRDEYKIMDIDINHITPINNIKTLKGDINEKEIEKEIVSYFNDKLDLIISDASINKKGDKFGDHITQIRLCYEILDLTRKILKKKGIFVLKCFQGSDFKIFYNDISKDFAIVKSYKPIGTKKKSNEIYLIGFNKKFKN